MATARAKILHLVEAALAGVGSHVTTMLANLDQRRFEHHLGYAPGRADDVFLARLPQLRARGVTVFAIPMVRSVSPWRDVAALHRITSYCKRNRYDIMQTYSAKAGILGRLATHWCGVPIVVHRPGAWSFLAARTTVTKAAYLAMEKMAGRWTDAVIVVSEHERQLTLQHRMVAPEKIFLVPNGIAPPPAPLSYDQVQRLRQEWGIDAGGLVFGSVLRFSEQKNPLGLISALATVLAEYSDARAVLIGSGPLLEASREAAARSGRASQFHFLGFRDNVRQLIATFDVFVLASRYEGCSFAVLEAMAAGLPVVTTAGGNVEAVRDGIEGLVVPPGGATQLVEALRTLAANPTLRLTLGKQARKRAEDFSLERQITRTESLYDQLLTQRDDGKL